VVETEWPQFYTANASEDDVFFDLNVDDVEEMAREIEWELQARNEQECEDAIDWEASLYDEMDADVSMDDGAATLHRQHEATGCMAVPSIGYAAELDSLLLVCDVCDSWLTW
jgi:hypothetical protein